VDNEDKDEVIAKDMEARVSSPAGSEKRGRDARVPGKAGGFAITPDKEKKQIPLRLSATLWKELTAWAEDDFRSLNGQIEYLLHECVKRRKKDQSS